MSSWVCNLSLFIFRRDLRINDNTGLIKALTESKYVIPLFILTPTQVSDSNKYKSSNAIQFMMESLYDLSQQIKDINQKCSLWITYGDEIDVIDEIDKQLKIDAIYLNEDYTPYAIFRDNKIKSYCKNNNIDLNISADILLADAHDIKSKNGNRYHNFTLFYKNLLKYPVRKPNYDILNNFKPLIPAFKKWKIHLMDKFLLDNNFYQINNQIAVFGGRTNAIEILKNIAKFKNYRKTKDYPIIPTTMLSAHNKFGTVSIREVYYAFRKEKTGDLCKNLYWRDFYYYVGIYFNQFYKYQHIFKKNAKKNIKWENNNHYFNAWKNGKTGFPLVDATMRQLNTTGFMHNRGRLIVSQFLTKDLLVDWKYGEKYFSKKLVDIDRAQNVGNWNWSSSFGLDSTPFLRIFNTWTQSKLYDPDCEYIKKWIPELKNINPQHIHKWYEYYHDYPNVKYPKPIVDHNVRRKKFVEFYKSYFKK